MNLRYFFLLALSLSLSSLNAAHRSDQAVVNARAIQQLIDGGLSPEEAADVYYVSMATARAVPSAPKPVDADEAAIRKLMTSLGLTYKEVQKIYFESITDAPDAPYGAALPTAHGCGACAGAGARPETRPLHDKAAHAGACRDAGAKLPVADVRAPGCIKRENLFSSHPIYIERAAEHITKSLPALKEKVDELLALFRMHQFGGSQLHWCTACSLPVTMRLSTILYQLNDIVTRYSPTTTEEIVHTAFAVHPSDLQAYLLGEGLRIIGYKKVHLNLIGIAADKKQIDGYKALFTRNYTDWIAISMYGTNYDYLNDRSAKKSHSFDMIDPGSFDCSHAEYCEPLEKFRKKQLYKHVHYQPNGLRLRQIAVYLHCNNPTSLSWFTWSGDQGSIKGEMRFIAALEDFLKTLPSELSYAERFERLLAHCLERGGDVSVHNNVEIDFDNLYPTMAADDKVITYELSIPRTSGDGIFAYYGGYIPLGHNLEKTAYQGLWFLRYQPGPIITPSQFRDNAGMQELARVFTRPAR